MTARHGVKLLAVVACAAMAITVVAGLRALGSPMHQRALQLDARRVSALNLITLQISNYGSQHKSLPPNLAALDVANTMINDPVSGAPFEYATTGSDTYRLCATFDTASEPQGPNAGPYLARWTHPAGRHCFDLSKKFEAGMVQPFRF